MRNPFNRYQPEWKPNIEFFQSLSKDGKYVISKTVITTIKPRKYLETILGLHDRADVEKPIAAPNSPTAREMDQHDRGD